MMVLGQVDEVREASEDDNTPKDLTGNRLCYRQQRILSCFFVLKTVIGTIICTNDRSVLSAETALVRIM